MVRFLALDTLVFSSLNLVPLCDSIPNKIPARCEINSWCNPGNAILERISDNVWVAPRPFIWQGIDVGGRMTVIKLNDNSLWVHSPVELDESLHSELMKIGNVGHIIAPNYEHVKFTQSWINFYDGAKSYGCPGMKSKYPSIDIDDELSSDDSVSPWQQEIEVCFVNAERNPFNSKPFFNEVVFFHKPSKSLITTDIYWNYPNNAPLGTLLWKFGMDKIYLPFYKKLMVHDTKRYDEICNKITKEWKPQYIIPCHGSIVTPPEDCNDILNRHLLKN